MAVVTEARRGGFVISDDPSRLDLDAVHAYLSRSYWAAGIPMDVLRRAAEHSLCFGVYRRDGGAEEQVGFARVITDRATFAYLANVMQIRWPNVYAARPDSEGEAAAPSGDRRAT